MSKSQIQRGNILDLVAPAGGVVSGTAYLIGTMLAVAQISAAAAAKFSGAVEGVHELPKESTADFSEGDIIFWDDAAKEFDETAVGRFPVGTCVEAAGTGVLTVKVKLAGQAVVAV